MRAADAPIFAALTAGAKTIETRAGSAAGPRSFLAVQPGDTLLFLHGAQRLRRRVTRVAVYPSVAALLAAEDYRRILPGAADPAAVAALYAAFPGYAARIAQYGIVALELAAIPAPP